VVGIDVTAIVEGALAEAATLSWRAIVFGEDVATDGGAAAGAGEVHASITLLEEVDGVVEVAVAAS
jgi:hypothetical protein